MSEIFGKECIIRQEWDCDWCPIYAECQEKRGEPMTNKEWLATLSAEDFYKEFKKAEEEGRMWTSTSAYVIKWLDGERKADGDI